MPPDIPPTPSRGAAEGGRTDRPEEAAGAQPAAGPAPAERPSRSDHPSALGLTRLTRVPVPPGGEALYRHIARLVELGPEMEFLVVPGGQGMTALLLAEATGAAGAGADPEPALVEESAARVRAAGLADRVHFERAPLDDLPYRDAVFDVVVGGIGLAAEADPMAVVRELVRVTRPLGTVVLVQLVWTGRVDAERRRELVDHLGVRPLLLVEWKQMLREAGVVELYVEDWSDAGGSGRSLGEAGLLAEYGSLKDRLVVLHRAWQRWGWRGTRELLSRQKELRELLTRERLLGLTLIKGTRWTGE